MRLVLCAALILPLGCSESASPEPPAEAVAPEPQRAAPEPEPEPEEAPEPEPEPEPPFDGPAALDEIVAAFTRVQIGETARRAQSAGHEEVDVDELRVAARSVIVDQGPATLQWLLARDSNMDESEREEEQRGFQTHIDTMVETVDTPSLQESVELLMEWLRPEEHCALFTRKVALWREAIAAVVPTVATELQERMREDPGRQANMNQEQSNTLGYISVVQRICAAEHPNPALFEGLDEDYSPSANIRPLRHWVSELSDVFSTAPDC